jgi:phosphatidylglycerol---prolipoprotein diacylglyceryl transferase
MSPVLFHLGSFPIYSYSIFIVLGYSIGLAYGWFEVKRLKQDTVHAADISIWLFFAGILGARLLFVLVFPRPFMEDPIEILRIWNGGLVWYGGLLGGGLAGIVYIIKHKLPFWLWTDILGHIIMLQLAIGRLGCYFNGCCYGRPVEDLWCSVVYPVSHPALGLLQVPVHPTPLYSGAACFSIFVFLAILQRFKKFDGQVFLTMLVLYPVSRFIIEFYRNDPRGKLELFGHTLFTSQVISLIVGSVAFIALFALFIKTFSTKVDLES